MKAILRMNLYGIISYLRSPNEHLHEVKPVMNRFNKTKERNATAALSRMAWRNMLFHRAF